MLAAKLFIAYSDTVGAHSLNVQTIAAMVRHP
jgi:hypothetical protein